MRIIGLDLSLSATGVADLYEGSCLLRTISPPRGMVGEERLVWLQGDILGRIAFGDSVVVEEIAYSRVQGGAFERGALHWMVRCGLVRRGIRFFLCPATTLKLFATGKGNAEKSMMLREVYRRWGVEAADDNQADAAALAYLGACLVGEREPENEAQRRAVASILTPKVKRSRKKEAA